MFLFLADGAEGQEDDGGPEEEAMEAEVGSPVGDGDDEGEDDEGDEGERRFEEDGEVEPEGGFVIVACEDDRGFGFHDGPLGGVHDEEEPWGSDGDE